MVETPATLMLCGTITLAQAKTIARICREKGPTYFYDDCGDKMLLRNALQLEEAIPGAATTAFLYSDEDGAAFSELEYYLKREGIPFQRTTTIEGYIEFVKVFDPKQAPEPISFYKDGPHQLTRLSYCLNALDHLRNGNIKDAIEYLEIGGAAYMAPLPAFRIADK